MDLADLTIFELPDLTEEDAWSGVRAKLAEFPELRDVYDEVFLSKLIAGRTTSTSRLLLRLVCTDDYAGEFWRTVISQMRVIGYPRALAAFAEKMRRDKPGNLESWTSELRYAAWLVEQGIAIELEPAIGDRKAEFSAATTTPTTWEIKTPADDDTQRAEQDALFTLQRLLRPLPTPAALSLSVDGDGDVPIDTHDVARQIKTRLSALDMDRTPFPFVMRFGTLRVSVSRASGDRGYVGSLMTSLQMLAGDHVARVAKIIRGAARQLPREGAGVVVIDGSNADWISKTSVADACFGADMMTYAPGVEPYPTRGANGVFNPKQNTRVSAVVFASPRFVHHQGESGVVVFYNPYARTPLADDWLPDKTIRHGRLYGTTRVPGARAVRLKGPDDVSYL
jgi:hypothetical protein